MYNLYLDKPTDFICELSIKNASLKDAFARIIVETTDGLALMFPGSIKDGKCHVPIKRMKGWIDEMSEGKLKLEVIVEDTYFVPWEDNFVVEEHTSIKVKVDEQKKPSKPIVEVRTIKNITPKLSGPAQDIVFICERVGINRKTFSKKTSDFKQVVKEYFKSSPEFVRGSKKYIHEAISALK